MNITLLFKVGHFSDDCICRHASLFTPISWHHLICVVRVTLKPINTNTGTLPRCWFIRRLKEETMKPTNLTLPRCWLIRRLKEETMKPTELKRPPFGRGLINNREAFKIHISDRIKSRQLFMKIWIFHLKKLDISSYKVLLCLVWQINEIRRVIPCQVV